MCSASLSFPSPLRYPRCRSICRAVVRFTNGAGGPTPGMNCSRPAKGLRAMTAWPNRRSITCSRPAAWSSGGRMPAGRWRSSASVIPGRSMKTTCASPRPRCSAPGENTPGRVRLSRGSITGPSTLGDASVTISGWGMSPLRAGITMPHSATWTAYPRAANMPITPSITRLILPMRAATMPWPDGISGRSARARPMARWLPITFCRSSSGKAITPM